MKPGGDTTELVAGRYRLGEALGRGGMGQVYRARDEVLDREVAIKLLLPAREDPAAVQRFQREARAAAKLSDPQIVATYDFGRHRDGFYLAMELVEGRTVSQEVKRTGPMAADRALAIIRQVAAGLADAHRHGLIHRDIKPGNLLLTDDDRVKIADFGIVRILDDPTTTLTAAGQIVGTSHYLAPERARGEPAEAASDIYALGCALYQMVTGHPPFMAEDPASIMYQHVETMPTPPSDLRPELAGEFEALLFWMLAKDPTDRPTAAQVAAGVAPPAMARTQTLPVLPVRRRRARNQLVVAAAVAVAALGATLGFVLDAKSDKLPATTEIKPPAASVSSTPAPPAPKTTPVRKPTPTPQATKSASTRTTRSADAGASAKPAEKATPPKKESGRGEQKKPDKEKEKGKSGKN